MRTVDGLTYVSVLDLNMGFWHLELDEPSQRLATIILPWGKYCYQRLAMGLSVSPDIYQERMSAIFADMENVIVFIDDSHSDQGYLPRSPTVIGGSLQTFERARPTSQRQKINILRGRSRVSGIRFDS